MRGRFQTDRITEVRQAGEDTVITLCADAFAPVVAVETEDARVHMSDNYFPLLPCAAKEVVIARRPGIVKAYAV